MAPAPKLDSRANILIIIPIFFLICCFLVRLQNTVKLVRNKLTAEQNNSCSVCITGRFCTQGTITVGHTGGISSTNLRLLQNPLPRLSSSRQARRLAEENHRLEGFPMWQHGRWEVGCFGEITLTGMASPPASISPPLSLSRQHP